MIENFLDHVLANPFIELDDVIDIIDCHNKNLPQSYIDEIKDDLNHAFSS